MKRRFKSYAECELAYDAAQTDSTVAAVVINAMINDERHGVFRKGAYTVRVYRPTAAHGGVVAVTYRAEGQSDYTTTEYLDKWAHVRQVWFPDSNDVEGVALNRLRYRAVEYRNREVGYLAS